MTTLRVHESSLRHERYDTIVVSPHLDDAVYSLAGTILAEQEAGRRVLVVTVFGHGRDRAPRGDGPYDDYATREQEDRDAMQALDVDYVWLNLPELIFRRPSLRERIAELVPHASLRDHRALVATEDALVDLVEAHATEVARIYLPLGIGAHPDHRLVFEAGRHALADRELRYYEDVPYALHEPLVRARLAVLGLRSAPRIRELARASAALLFRGLARALAYLPLLAYFALVEGIRRLRTHGEVPRLELVHALDLGPRLRAKADAMRAYRTQTPLFFESGVERSLSADGSHEERAWRFA